MLLSNSSNKFNNNNSPSNNKLHSRHHRINSRISIPFSSKAPSNSSSNLTMDSLNSNKWTPQSCLHLLRWTKKSNKILVVLLVLMELKTLTAVTWVTQPARKLHNRRPSSRWTIISKMRQTNLSSSQICRIWMCSLINKMGANQTITINKYKATLQVSNRTLIHTSSNLTLIH